MQWDLQPFNISIPIGQGFNGLLPGWGAGKLVAATTGLVVQSTSSNRPSTAGGITTNTTITNAVLHADSLTDVTTLVGADGRLDLNLDASSTGQHYVLFAYYLVRSGYREIQTPPLLVGAPQSSVRNYVQNGSFVVDHFSSHGAETVAKFWKDHLLNNSDTVELLAEVGNYLWEASDYARRLSVYLLTSRCKCAGLTRISCKPGLDSKFTKYLRGQKRIQYSALSAHSVQWRKRKCCERRATSRCVLHY